MQKVLVLGAGLVAKPLVEYLLNHNYNVVIASNTISAADKILGDHKSGSSVYWEGGDLEGLEEMVKNSSIVVSLLPYSFHPSVARVCLRYEKPMVTTSYVSDEMMKLDGEAREKGVLILNEIGLDPGIDHMSAMRIIDQIHSRNGKVSKFYSICGALPSAENADNPMQYKFSWSPKGVILASRNSARYLKNGLEVKIDPINLFKDRFSYTVEGVGEMEVYPNRDSISYIDIYGIPESDTIFRGTFRFPGWCETLDVMKQLNMLDDKKTDYTGKTYNDFLKILLPEGIRPTEDGLAKYLGLSPDCKAIDSFKWLGLFTDHKMNYGLSSPFEIISDLMISKMMLAGNEKDMIVLQHLFLASYPDGKREHISSQMVDFGSPATNTSISRTVGLPAAIAVRMILEKKIEVTGVHRPIIAEIYNPVLDELELMNIKLKEVYGLPESAMIE